MRIGALSQASGVPVPTIKFYLREGLLAPGEATGASNQADYGAAHLHRLHLIRTLMHVGGLSVAAAREALAAVDDDSVAPHEMLTSAILGLRRTVPATATPASSPQAERARADVEAYLDALGWSEASPGSPARDTLADALLALRHLGRDVGPEIFDPYTRLADELAARELATIPTDAPRAQIVEQAVVGTIVFEAALIALRRLAEAKHSADRFDPRRNT